MTTTTTEYQIVLEYTISEYRLQELKTTAKYGYIESDTFTVADISGVHYYLRIYPNGLNDEHQGKMIIYLYLIPGAFKKIEASYTLSIKSANWIQKMNNIFEKRTGKGTWCCTMKELFDKKEKFIFNGKFVLELEGILKIEDDESKNKMDKFSWEKTMNFRDLWKIGHEDFTIICEKKEIKVHKCVLAAHSKVFCAMFNSSLKEAYENQVTISDFTFDIVSLAIKLCYNQASISDDISIDNAFSLLQFTDKYDMEIIKDNLEYYLCDKLTVANLCEIVNSAIEGNAVKLQNKCLDLFINCLSMKHPVPNMDILEKDFFIAAINKLSCRKSQAL